jgi:hypothetical protein
VHLILPVVADTKVVGKTMQERLVLVDHSLVEHKELLGVVVVVA